MDLHLRLDSASDVRFLQTVRDFSAIKTGVILTAATAGVWSHPSPLGVSQSGTPSAH